MSSHVKIEGKLVETLDNVTVIFKSGFFYFFMVFNRLLLFLS